MFVFWLGTLGAKKVPVKGVVTGTVPSGAAAQPGDWSLMKKGFNQ